ncbi:hypothetical protein [uncultured Amnibacterium sp.]|uniref:hypothetical protein n=1 Tax=uncultured Amnibacterium sp. TaxID=1631851 RepID=UPI0035CB6F14
MHRSDGHARRLRTAVVGALVATLAGALLAGGGVIGPAQAATPTAKPPVSLTHLIAGNRTVSVSWHAVPHAKRYAVRISRHKSMSAATTKHTTLTHAILHSLKNERTLWMQVTAELTNGRTLRSPVRTTTPSAGLPTPVTGVTATAAGANRVRVRWSGGGTATHVAVAAGADLLAVTLRFHSTWLPATTRSVVLTVPEALRPQLGSTSAQPVFVRVLQTNSVSLHPVKGTGNDSAARLRLSDPGAWALAGPPAPAADSSRLTVGEFNVQSVGASKGFTVADQWAARKPRVVATIERAHPDLLTTAELSTSLVRPCISGNDPAANIWCSADSMDSDLAGQLATGPAPYALATPDAYRLVHLEMLQHPEWNNAVTAGAHIFYDPTRLHPEANGFVSPVFDLQVPGWTPAIGDRWASWARFTMLDGTNRRFIAVASHFPVGNTAQIVALRAEEATRLIAYLDRLNTEHLPIVFTGDLNADPVRQQNAAPTAFIRAGYVDAAATTNRVGIQYGTQNSGNGNDGPDDGYPRHVIPRTTPASRIDYILLLHSPNTFAYANVLALNGTAFVPELQGSDHNLQLATIGIGAPAG